VQRISKRCVLNEYTFGILQFDILRPIPQFKRRFINMTIDLNVLSLSELKNLKAQVEKAISTFESRKKKEALSQLEEKARELGFSLAELTGATAVRKRAPAAAKFANPENASDTWSGRGRKPRWFVAALAAGKSPDDLSV
jgi:DNA-binding protein H-NS